MEWSTSNQTQMHGRFDLSQSYPGHLIAVLGHHREVKCTVWFSNCEPVDEDEDDRKHPARREVTCASPSVDEYNHYRKHPARREVPCASMSVDEDNEDENKEDDDDADKKDDNTPPEQLQQRPRKKSKLAWSGNGSISAAVMKIFLVTQDSIDLERPTRAKFVILWDATKKMHEHSVIQGSAEADNQLVEIIRKKLRDKQLPHASDRPFGNSCGLHNGIGMGNSWVPSTNTHVVKTAEEMQTDYPVR